MNFQYSFKKPQLEVRTVKFEPGLLNIIFLYEDIFPTNKIQNNGDD